MPLVKFGGRRLLLSASDLVLPLCCGIVLHLFFVISLCITHYFLPLTHCTHIIYWFIYIALLCHGFIVIVNFIGTCIGFRVKVMNYSVWLTRILYIRTALNGIDVMIALWGLYLIIIRELQCLEHIPYILLVTSVSINWIILLIGCCGVCCLSSSESKQDIIPNTDINIEMDNKHRTIRTSSTDALHENDPSSKKIESKMRTICCACLWENRAWNHGEVGVAFNEIVSMVEMLTQTQHIKHDHIQNVAPSDIFTGLQLLRMLQKHYQLHDLAFYRPYTMHNYKHKFMSTQITECNERVLEIGTKNTKYTKKSKHKGDNDLFMALVDVSRSDGDEKNKNKPSQIIIPMDEEEKYSSASTTPQSPLLTNDTEGFGTFDIDYSTDNNLKYIESVQSNLHRGMQPKLSQDEIYRISEGIYYSKYGIACYGLPLYTLEYPLGILCALPCSMPNGLSADRIYGAACCGLSSIKVFLRRSGIHGSDLLCASQLSGLHLVTFFIAIDRLKESVVIAVRGSESMPDGMIDVNCKPTHCPSIDSECYCHDGFRLSMLQLFESLEKHELTQSFLANNKDYGIVVVGHSMGAAVALTLTLQLIHNKGENENYKDRDIHCYAIAPPPAINTFYANKKMKEMEEYITAFIYNKDIVPRLQWNSVMKTKCAVMRLLTECNQSSWWVYRHGLSVHNKTILSALKDTSRYVLYDDDIKRSISQHLIIEEEEKEDTNDDDNNDNDHYLVELNHVQSEFVRDIKSDMKELNHLMSSSPNHMRDRGVSLWSIKLQHVGMLFHIVNGNEVNTMERDRSAMFEKEVVCCSCCCSAICNCLRCKCCSPSSINPLKRDNYIIYRADPNGFDDVIVSSRSVSDHMPHVYKNVLHSLDLTQFK